MSHVLPDRHRTRTTRLAAGCATLAAAAALVAFPTAAHAAPGDNGDVKIHESTTAVDDQRDEPKVCKFYLDAFNFDTLQQVTWTIDQQPPTGTAQVLAGAIALTSGSGRSADLTLPNGHYKLNWTFEGENGSGKHKVFEVDCPPPPSSPPSGGPSSPGTPGNPGGGGGAGQPGGSAPVGSVGAGLGGSVHETSVPEIAAGGVVIAGAAWFGLRAWRRARRHDTV